MNSCRQILLLLLSTFFHQLASSQCVDLFVGELNGNVYVEWSGTLTALYQAMPFTATTTTQFTGDAFAWAAFADPNYSFMTGSPLVTYNYNSPGVFTAIPDMFMGDAIGLTGGTTVFIPNGYETMLGNPIFGCMQFTGQSFASLGIIDGQTSSVTWNDPAGVEPQQKITMQTSSAHFPSNYPICFPTPTPTPAPTPVPTPAPTAVTPVPTVPTDNTLAIIGGILGGLAAVGGAALVGGAGLAAGARLIGDSGDGPGDSLDLDGPDHSKDDKDDSWDFSLDHPHDKKKDDKKDGLFERRLREKLLRHRTMRVRGR